MASSLLLHGLAISIRAHHRTSMQCCNLLRRHISPGVARSASITVAPYLWITDEHLNEAFARFARVSKSSRRAGSNVPGPLEARRRHARRRIGSVSGAGHVTDLAEFGALFGSGEERAGIYEYRPPIQVKDAGSRRISDSGSPKGTTISNSRPWDQFAPPTNTEDLLLYVPIQTNEMQALARVKRQDMVKASRSQFKKLLDEMDLSKQMTAEAITPLLTYLQSAQDQPGSGNLGTLLTWLAWQTVDISIFEAIRDMIISKSELKTLSLVEFKATLYPLLSIFRDEVDTNKRAVYLETLPLLADHIKRLHDAKVCSDGRLGVVYRQLFKSILPTDNTLSSLALSSEALSVLAVKRDEIHIAGSFVGQALKDTLIRLLHHEHNQFSRHFKMINEAFVTTLNTSKEPHLAPAVMHILLHDALLLRGEERFGNRLRRLVIFWLRCLYASDRMSNKASKITFIESWATYCVIGQKLLPKHLALHLQHLEPVQQATALLFGWSSSWGFKQHGAPQAECVVKYTIHGSQVRFTLDTAAELLFRQWHFSNMSSIQDPILSLLPTVREDPCRVYHLLQDLFAVLSHGQFRTHRLYELYTNIKALDLEIPRSSRESIINNLASNGYSIRALHILLESPDILLPNVPNLTRQLVADTDPAYILWLLRYKVPMPYNQIPQNVMDLVMDLATEVAHAEHYPPNRAYNRVWRCYQFLVSRNVLPGVTISKAMVHSGITRALQERKPLPNARLDYIIRTVRSYEGDDVADRLDEVTKAEREKYSSSKEPPKVFRPELDYLVRWRKTLVPRF